MIEIIQLHKTFSKKDNHLEAVRGIDLSIKKRSITAMVGPSGCGKSTVLNMIAGLNQPTSGRVIYNGEPTTKLNTSVGYMTQKDNLFPWLTVRKNVVLPLELAAYDRDQRNRKADKILERVDLKGFESKFPNELSGGMRKRVCLARMLIYQPETLLLDEPFAALDAQLKLAMHELLIKLWSENRQTIIFVTHDLVEAITLADRVVVLTKRPAQVVCKQDIDLERPRDILNIRFSVKFKEIYDGLWNRLRREYEDERL
jgi:NitT/TauT family transport system ATP-binding protein